jgi:hypothetical protein
MEPLDRPETRKSQGRREEERLETHSPCFTPSHSIDSQRFSPSSISVLIGDASPKRPGERFCEASLTEMLEPLDVCALPCFLRLLTHPS